MTMKCSQCYEMNFYVSEYGWACLNKNVIQNGLVCQIHSFKWKKKTQKNNVAYTGFIVWYSQSLVI